MTTLYFTVPGTTVHKVDERLVVRKDNKVVEDIPLLHVTQVAVIGRGIEITTEALLAMVVRQIDVCFFSRNLEFRARAVGELSSHGPLRFLQARYVDDLARPLALAKIFVRGKLINQQNALRLAEENRLPEEISRVIIGLRDARDLDSLRGYEGQGAALYFRGLRRLLPDAKAWGFERREFYPPPDPVNALLSYAYSLLTREVLAALHLSGLDPYLGFFHAIDYRRPSLALDVVEEFRPVIDRLVLALIAEKQITLADFETASFGEGATGKTVRLKDAPRLRFLKAYEEYLEEYSVYEPARRRYKLRRIITEQVQLLARVFKGEAERYQPFELPLKER